MKDRKSWCAGLVAALGMCSVLALVVAQPGCVKRGEDSPRETFDRALRYIEDGKYDDVWGLYSAKWQQSISDSYKGMKKSAAKAGTNAAEYDRLMQANHGMKVAQFIASSPRVLHETNLAMRREELLRYRIVGEPVINGNRATVEIEMRPDYPTTTWEFVRQEGGGWLIDDTPMPK